LKAFAGVNQMRQVRAYGLHHQTVTVTHKPKQEQFKNAESEQRTASVPLWNISKRLSKPEAI
jgi:hypothetical protein